MIARRPPVMKIRSRRRYTFVLVVAAWWVVGIFGLNGGRLASFPLVIVALVAIVVFGFAGAHRRRTELLREQIVRRAPECSSRNCIVLGPFGETEPSAWSRN
jgi:hypothetical protein